MKKHELLKKPERPGRNRIALRGGSYSLAITAVVLAILIVINILASVLPAAVTKYDISSTKLYSITSNTKAVVNAAGKGCDNLLGSCAICGRDDVTKICLINMKACRIILRLSRRILMFIRLLRHSITSETVANNSLVVECGDRSRYIGYDDIYLYEPNMTSYSYNASFDGEGAITSAIDYVVNEEMPQVYVLEGHGEAELPEAFSDQIEKENMELTTFSLLTEDSVPEEADCVLIYAPASDISIEEKDLLAKYVSGGGKLMVLAGPVENGTLENLYSLLEDYGVEAAEGIVVETDQGHYAFQAPYILLPNLQSSEITDPLIQEHYYSIIPIAQGLTVKGADSAEVTELLTTSETAFSKTDGYGLTTYEKEEGDTDGPFAVAVSVACGNDGQMIWFTSSHFLDDMYNAYSSGANLDLGMNALSSLIGESEAVAIRSKSLNYNYLTISDSTASLLKTVMIGVFPLLYLGIGICVVVRRRRKDEPV